MGIDYDDSYHEDSFGVGADGRVGAAGQSSSLGRAQAVATTGRTNWPELLLAMAYNAITGRLEVEVVQASQLRIPGSVNKPPGELVPVASLFHTSPVELTLAASKSLSEDEVGGDGSFLMICSRLSLRKQPC
ncbi:unnamed protein product [Protopolystoma xenopodis]|uniref:Uncharacterized protein n=1 Tax=Protopolystoma xenopodis TaxID=117903 RepID=A0A448WGZ0_9PLAT|nr:unnamed protein product [Protopolystoma xenopodis]